MYIYAYIYIYTHTHTYTQVIAEDAAEFAVGDTVRGLYKNGRWYDAAIAEVHIDGSYTLDWADGDVQDRVKRKSHIRCVCVYACMYVCMYVCVLILIFKTE